MAASEALQRMMDDSGAKFLFLSESMRSLAEPFVDKLNLVAHGLIAIDFDAPGFDAYESALDTSPANDPNVAVDWDDPFNIIYSSGTTGVPKGILHDHWMRAVQIARYIENGYDKTARSLLSTPLYSNTTIVVLLPTLAGGGTVVLMPKFDARGYLELVERESCTHTMLVPVQYKRIMDVPDFDQFDLSSMREKFSTSAPLRSDVKRDVLARFPGGLTEYYGLTEGGGYTVLKAHEHPDKLDTVGQPAPTVELKFIDDEGCEVPKGKPGEICGRSAAMMRGYFNAPDKTADYLWTDKDGRVFFRSGDMGVMDDEGFLHLTDRKKDMIISGGLNIFANDLELALLADPDVDDAAVIGIPSEQWGETPLGLIVLRKHAKRCAEDILESANDRLGKSQRLSGVELREHLPRSSIGKILKRELREPYWKETK
jgi:acyl-CoA synthetase (AMP-forming)/AMP-acid ligase II